MKGHSFAWAAEPQYRLEPASTLRLRLFRKDTVDPVKVLEVPVSVAVGDGFEVDFGEIKEPGTYWYRGDMIGDQSGEAMDGLSFVSNELTITAPQTFAVRQPLGGRLSV